MTFTKHDYVKLLDCVINEKHIFMANNADQLTTEYDLLILKLKGEIDDGSIKTSNE